MLPLVVALLSWPILGQALNRRQWIGTFVGVAGVLVASGWSNNHAEFPLWVYALPVLGTTALALATLLQKRSASHAMPVYQSLCIQCLSASVLFVGLAWNEGGVLPMLNPGFIGGVLWLVFIATFGAWGLYYIALRKSSPARVTAILYLSPPVTMVWAWVLFNEPLSWAMVVGLLVSLVGIVIAYANTLGTRLLRRRKASGMPEPNKGRRYMRKASVTPVPALSMNSSSITRVLPATASSGSSS
jgi:drug/metabolite transporter (DMT)-like permease